MNILLTAIGSVSAYDSCVALKKTSNTVYGCDIYPEKWLANTEEFKKVFLVSKASEQNKYLFEILTICNENNIDIIIPLTDIECDLLSQHKITFEGNGIKIACFDSALQSMCRNKLLMSKRLSNVCKCIETYTVNETINADFPLMLKPINGRSSQAQLIAYTQNELDVYKTLRDDYIIQPFIKGDVFTVDVVQDKFANCFCVVRHELLRTVSGLGTTVKMFSEHKLIEICKNIAKDIGFVGTVNMEFINNGDEFYFLEINPRFSGGIGFSLLAGYDFINAHLDSHLGKQICTNANIEELQMVQYYKKQIRV